MLRVCEVGGHVCSHIANLCSLGRIPLLVGLEEAVQLVCRSRYTDVGEEAHGDAALLREGNHSLADVLESLVLRKIHYRARSDAMNELVEGKGGRVGESFNLLESALWKGSNGEGLVGGLVGGLGLCHSVITVF